MLLICTKYDYWMLCWVYTTDNMEYIILDNLDTYACDRWFKYIKYYINILYFVLSINSDSCTNIYDGWMFCCAYISRACNMLFWAIFNIFICVIVLGVENYIFQKFRKVFLGSWSCICIPNIMIIGCFIQKWLEMMQSFFAFCIILGHFLTFLSLWQKKKLNFLTNKKDHLGTMNSHLCDKIYDYWMFCYLFITTDGWTNWAQIGRQKLMQIGGYPAWKLKLANVWNSKKLERFSRQKLFSTMLFVNIDRV